LRRGLVVQRTETGLRPDHAGDLRRRGPLSPALPPPRFEAGRIPARARTAELWNHPIRLGAELGTPQIFALNVGNAQCVVWVRRFERNWRSLGAAIERHSLFPDRTNVAFARRAPEGLEVRLWERGVGETPSSGTGAAAAVVVGARLGRTPRRVVVHMPGGDMKVQWKRSGPLTLSCEVTCIARGMLHARGAP
jgi:diaminopimelate epimerase